MWFVAVNLMAGKWSGGPTSVLDMFAWLILHSLYFMDGFSEWRVGCFKIQCENYAHKTQIAIENNCQNNH